MRLAVYLPWFYGYNSASHSSRECQPHGGQWEAPRKSHFQEIYREIEKFLWWVFLSTTWMEIPGSFSKTCRHPVDCAHYVFLNTQRHTHTHAHTYVHTHTTHAQHTHTITSSQLNIWSVTRGLRGPPYTGYRPKFHTSSAHYHHISHLSPQGRVQQLYGSRWGGGLPHSGRCNPFVSDDGSVLGLATPTVLLVTPPTSLNCLLP